MVGIEPTTSGLRYRCSTTELHRLKRWKNEALQCPREGATTVHFRRAARQSLDTRTSLRARNSTDQQHRQGFGAGPAQHRVGRRRLLQSHPMRHQAPQIHPAFAQRHHHRPHVFAHRMRHTRGGIIRPRLINRITVARPRLGRADELKLEAIRTESRAPPGNTILPCGTPSGATARCGFKRSTTALASLAARGILRAKDRSGHRLLKNTRRHARLRLHRARLRPLAGRPVWADHARALRHGTAPLRNIAVVSLVETPAPDDRRACDDANAAPRAAVPPEPAVRQPARAIFTAALPDIEAAGLRVPRDLSIIV